MSEQDTTTGLTQQEYVEQLERERDEARGQVERVKALVPDWRASGDEGESWMADELEAELKG